MKEARPHTSTMHPNMNTTNRGSILDTSGRGARAWPPGNPGKRGSNTVDEPDDFYPGPGGERGIMDSMAVHDWMDDEMGGRSHA